MSFRYKNFTRVGYNYSVSPACFAYSAPESLNDIVAAGYFSDPRATISVGDFIFVNASDGSELFVATSSTTVNALPILSTGWATYVDTQYPTAGTAFTVLANTDTAIPNNAGSKIEFQMPPDIDSFYDGTVITGRSGDSLDIMIFFKAVPSAVNQWAEIWIDIGGSIGELYRQPVTFPKGAGVERGVMYTIPSGYTLDTWEANGGTVYIESNADLDIYKINYNFDRSHKAR